MKSESDLSGMKVMLEIPLLLTENQVQIKIPEKTQLILFLDYDGTLSPIVDYPEEAVLSPEMKQILEKCASMYILGIISGRDLNDVIERVDIDGIFYAGNHGLTIQGPGNMAMEHEEAIQILPVFKEIYEKLTGEFSHGPGGVQIERKKYSITVHYRNARDDAKGEIESKTDIIISEYKNIQKERGKKIIEIKPAVYWSKGMALKWILSKTGRWEDPSIFPIYIGDDITDEDAFKMIHPKGIGVIVGLHENKLTHADYRLKDVDEVKVFLEILAGTR